MASSRFSVKREIAVIGTRKRNGTEEALKLLEVNFDGEKRSMYDIRWWRGETGLHGITMNLESLAELGRSIDSVQDFDI